MNIKQQLITPLVTLIKTFSGTEEIQVNVPDYSNVFGFYSPTGGTGVTTFVANLGYVLASQLKVAIVDFDLYHPALFRFLLDDSDDKTGLHPEADLVDKLITSGANITSFGHTSKYNNITLFTGMPQDDIIKFCELDYNNIVQCIKELSRLYDIVLVDFKGNLAQETVMASIDACTRVFTFIRPLFSDVDSMHKDNDLLIRYGYGKKLTAIVQANIQKRYLPDSAFDDEDISTVMRLPYVKSVEDTGESFDIFYATNAGSSKAGAAYAECCKFMAEYLCNYERMIFEEGDEK